MARYRVVKFENQLYQKLMLDTPREL